MGQKSGKYLFWGTSGNNAPRGKQADRRQGLGSVIFVLGMPCSIVGVILTIVAYANKNEDEKVPLFYTLGPVFLGLAVFCFILGAILAQLLHRKDMMALFCCVGRESVFRKWCLHKSVQCMRERDPVLRMERGSRRLRQKSGEDSSRNHLEEPKNWSNSPSSGSRPVSGGSATSSEGTKSFVSLRQCKVHPSNMMGVSELSAETNIDVNEMDAFCVHSHPIDDT